MQWGFQLRNPYSGYASGGSRYFVIHTSRRKKPIIDHTRLSPAAPAVHQDRQCFDAQGTIELGYKAAASACTFYVL